MGQKAYVRALEASINERDRLVSLYDREIKKIYKTLAGETIFNIKNVKETSRLLYILFLKL